MRPSSVETSEPAWVNRKMLSMKSSTSWFCSSRKYSAIVSADSATRSRVPGGSSIWPKTSAVDSMTPDSVISVMRSLPSRVRSPTPANTDTPPNSWATRRIISWISTVLPTPAPPNRPIFPPATYGVSRSMTLMPVSSISVRPSSWSNRGACRWIVQCGASLPYPGVSRHSPRALNTWPLVASPTGTEIAEPVSVTSAPRTRPSVGCMEIVRTTLSPRCWATSRVSVLPRSARVTSTVRALNRSGIASRGNSTSTTGPVTRTTRPAAAVCWVLGRSSVTVICTALLPWGWVVSRPEVFPPAARGAAGGRRSVVGAGRHERVGAADDLADLLGDLVLAGLVGLPGEVLRQLLGVVRRRLHRAAPGRRLRRCRLQHRRVDARRDVLRQQRVEQRLGRGLELVRGRNARVACDAGLAVLPLVVELLDLLDHQRGHPLGDRHLAEQRAELGVDDVQLVHAGVVGGLVVVLTGGERVDQGAPDLLRVDVVRLFGEAGERLLERPVAEGVVGLHLAPDDVEHRRLALLPEQREQFLGAAQHVDVVRAGEPAVGGDHQDRRPARVLALGQQRMVKRGRSGQRGEHPRDLPGVGLGGLHPGLGAHDAGAGDQLLGREDLLRRLGGADAAPQRAEVAGHVRRSS